MKINRTSVFYNAMMLTFSSLVMQILFFIYRIIITRFSGAGGLGIYSLAMPFYSIVSSISLSGITMAVTRLTVEKTAVGEREVSANVVHRAVQIFISLITILGVLTYIFPDFIAQYILGEPKTRLTMLLIIPCLFLTGFENILKSFFYGSRYIKPNIISETCEIVLRIAILFSLLYFNKSILTPEITSFLILTGMILSEIFSVLFLGFCYKFYNLKHKIIFKAAKSKHITKEIAKIAVPISAASLLLTIISAINTILIPKRLVVSGFTQTGAVETLGALMGMASPLVGFPFIFVGPLMNAVLPKIAYAKKLGDNFEVVRKIRKTLQVCAFMTFPAIGIMAVIGKPLCLLMYKNEVAAQYMLPLTLSSVLVCFQAVTGSILNGIDKQKELAAFNVIDGIVHIFFTYFFTAIPNFGVYGFILGHFASSLVGTVLNFSLVLRETKIKADIKNWFFMPVASGLYTAATVHFIHLFCLKITGAELISVIISILFGILIYISILELFDVSIIRYIKRLRVDDMNKKIVKRILSEQ